MSSNEMTYWPKRFFSQLAKLGIHFFQAKYAVLPLSAGRAYFNIELGFKLTPT